MTITVLHLPYLGELTEMALQARLARGESSAATERYALREKVRRPSLGWSVERLEAAAESPFRRRQYFSLLRNTHIAFASALYMSGYYVAVATVEGEDLDLAFQLTNSHEAAWTEVSDPRLQVVPGACATSSQIGDLFRDDATGEIYLCTSDGFASLGPLVVAQVA